MGTVCQVSKDSLSPFRLEQARYSDETVDIPGHWIEEEFEVPYPSLFDPAGEFAATLGYPGLPATFVVDATGMIRFRQFGQITERQLISMLDQVLEG